MKLDARIVVALLSVVYRLLLRWSVEGRKRVPRDGALILIANHVHLADPVLLMLAFPRHITFLAKEELFHIPFVGMIMRHGGMFPVARGGSLQQKRDVMRQAEDLLSQGRVLALFPEGKRSHDGVLLPAKPGAAILSLHSGAPLIPVAIVGTEQIRGWRWLFRRPRVTVTIGEPFRLEANEGRIGRSESVRLTDDLMRRIALMLPPAHRGAYANRQGE